LVELGIGVCLKLGDGLLRVEWAVGLVDPTAGGCC